MDLIILIGAGAVGKMTVGQELMKITDFRLFHNHMMIEPVLEIFGRFDGEVVSKLREDIFDAFMKTKYQGMIFTFMWGFDMPSDWDYIKGVSEKFEATGGTVYYVELVADQAVRLERNKTENRLKNKASKRNLELSEERMIREETKFRLESREGEIPFPNYIKIDNTNLGPDEVAGMIKKHFNLPNPSAEEMMNRVFL
nr:AAA family ATPase [Lachnospiraceae bacterium]